MKEIVVPERIRVSYSRWVEFGHRASAAADVREATLERYRTRPEEALATAYVDYLLQEEQQKRNAVSLWATITAWVDAKTSAEWHAYQELEGEYTARKEAYYALVRRRDDAIADLAAGRADAHDDQEPLTFDWQV